MSQVFNNQELPVSGGLFQVSVDAGTGTVSMDQIARGIPQHLLAQTQKTADDDYVLGPLPDCTLIITITGDAKMYIIPL